MEYKDLLEQAKGGNSYDENGIKKYSTSNKQRQNEYHCQCYKCPNYRMYGLHFVVRAFCFIKIFALPRKIAYLSNAVQ